MKKCFSVFLLISSALCSAAQTNDSVKIELGSSLPDVAYVLHTGDKSHTVHLSEFKGEAVLLDFYSTSCGVCLNVMPEIYKLQKRFAGRLKVIIVARESEDEVQRVWRRMRKASLAANCLEAANQLSFITSDSMLFKIFPPVSGLPMYVWLDKEGKYRANATLASTSERNMELFLAGKPVPWSVYTIPTLKGSVTAETWVKSRIGDQIQLRSYSFTSNYDNAIMVEGTNPQLFQDSNSMSVIAINQTIVNLYKFAYQVKYGPVYDYNLSINLDDVSRIKLPLNANESESMSWYMDNSYCYVFKGQTMMSRSELFEKMLHDLDLAFHLESRIESRLMKCYVLVKSGEKDVPVCRGEEDPLAEVTEDKGVKRFIIHNRTIDDPVSLKGQLIRDYISGRGISVPVFDETHVNDKIDIDIQWGKNNYSIPSLREELNKYGLDIIEDYRNIDVLVIKDKTSPAGKQS